MSKKTETTTADYKLMQWIDFGCYPGQLLFVQQYNYKEVIKHLKTQGAHEYVKAIKEMYRADTFFSGERDDTGGPAAASAYQGEVKYKKNKYNIFLICSPKGMDITEPRDMIFLAHECLHICQFYLPDLMDRNTEIEAEAYFHGHLMRQVITALKETKEELDKEDKKKSKK